MSSISTHENLRSRLRSQTRIRERPLAQDAVGLYYDKVYQKVVSKLNSWVQSWNDAEYIVFQDEWVKQLPFLFKGLTRSHFRDRSIWKEIQTTGIVWFAEHWRMPHDSRRRQAWNPDAYATVLRRQLSVEGFRMYVEWLQRFHDSILKTHSRFQQEVSRDDIGQLFSEFGFSEDDVWGEGRGVSFALVRTVYETKVSSDPDQNQKYLGLFERIRSIYPDYIRLRQKEPTGV